MKLLRLLILPFVDSALDKSNRVFLGRPRAKRKAALKCPGVRTQGSPGLLDNTHSGLELRHASIWLDNVCSDLTAQHNDSKTELN
ncbi:hypothetical protein TNCV_4851601 [Trichonephila clavipes]|nr:hypothetical protein TNCV_4851601 [Trichonephila clavipes]